MRIVRWVAYVSVFMVLFLLLNQPTSAAGPKDAISDLDAFITKAYKNYQVPGAAVAVVKDGKVIWAKGYGVRDVTKPDKVDENTIFRLASVTKAFTATAAGVIVDDKKLDWDTPIVNYLPEFVRYDPYMTRWLTMRDLLAHRTGWPAYTGDWLNNFGYDPTEILRRLRYLKPRYSLREVAQYSNPGFWVAGEVAGRASGQSWNELVEKQLLVPLKMTRSRTSAKDSQDSNASAFHTLVDGKVQVVPPPNPDTIGASGSVTSTALDMTHWMLMLLNKGSYAGTPVLKPETVAEIFKRSMVSEIEFTDLPPISETTGFYYGLGFDSFDYAGHHIIEKAGALGGVRTIVTLVPAKNTGIVVLTNLNFTALPEAVRAYYLNQVLGIDPETDQKEIFEQNKQLAKLLAPPPAPTNPGQFQGTLSSLVGVYDNDLYGRCEILLNGKTLGVEWGPTKFPATLKHWNNGMFGMQFPGATSGVDDVTFSIGEDGTADSFTHETLGIFTRVKQSSK